MAPASSAACSRPSPEAGTRKYAREAASAQCTLPREDKARLVADESMLDAADARALAQEPRAFGVFNVKLMKCGGITPALDIAGIAYKEGKEKGATGRPVPLLVTWLLSQEASAP